MGQSISLRLTQILECDPYMSHDHQGLVPANAAL